MPEETADQLQKLTDIALKIWGHMLEEKGGLHPAIKHMATALHELRITKAAYITGLAPTDVTSCSSEDIWHVFDFDKHGPACDKEFPLVDRITSSHGIPTCPECQELLRQTQNQ